VISDAVVATMPRYPAVLGKQDTVHLFTEGTSPPCHCGMINRSVVSLFVDMMLCSLSNVWVETRRC